MRSLFLALAILSLAACDSVVSKRWVSDPTDKTIQANCIYVFTYVPLPITSGKTTTIILTPIYADGHETLAIRYGVLEQVRKSGKVEVFTDTIITARLSGCR